MSERKVLLVISVRPDDEALRCEALWSADHARVPDLSNNSLSRRGQNRRQSIPLQV